nr:VOC family protein [Streptomyces albus]
MHTSGPAAAERFYEAVLGWGYVRTGPAYDHYRYATWQRHMVAGIAPSGRDEDPGDAPAAASWIVSFAVERADALAERVVAAGGEVRHGPGDVGVLGRTVTAVDPEGAHVGFWQPRAHLGAGLFDEPSALCWAELAVRDTERADRFYEAVLGLLPADHTAVGGEHYAAYRLPGEVAGAGGPAGAGRTLLRAEQPDEEAFWMPYFGARDARAAVATARREGASVLYEGMNGEGLEVAVVRDPQGAVFGVLERAARPEP